MTNKLHNWYVRNIRRPVEWQEARDETEAAVNIIIRALFGDTQLAGPRKGTADEEGAV